MAVRVSCLKSTIKKNGKRYPVLIGMATGRQIHGFSFVPNFSPDDSNVVIAQRLLKPLEDNWQRPANTKRIENIDKLYKKSESNQIMVNPVLLGAIPGQEERIKIIKETAIPGGTNDQKLVTIEFSQGESVWVIDGQHRINGMKRSNQPMPFVLLYDSTSSTKYTGAYLAELFSIVTTKATSMKPIHKEWMSFAYQLDKYTDPTKQEMMKVILLLATTQDFGSGHANENFFYDQIQFNDDISVNPEIVGAFSFTSPNFFSQLDSSPGKSLLKRYSNKSIAATISNFLYVVKNLHGQPHKKSILFGKKSKDFIIIGAGLIDAWLWYTSTLPMLPSFTETQKLLENIGFQNSNWDFLDWNTGPSTNEKSAMRVTIRTTFFQLFMGIIQPPKEIGNYLTGKESAKLELSFSASTGNAIDKKSTINVVIDAFTNKEIVLEIPKYGGKVRNLLYHNYVRSNVPTLEGGHSPNCRVSSFKIVDDRGKAISDTKESFDALKNKKTGVNIGIGRISNLELITRSIDEKSPKYVRIQVLNVD